MSASPETHVESIPTTGARAVVEGLLRCGITCGFGIPSIHNIAIYEGLRQTPDFQHWVVRHEQAAGFAADGFFRCSGKVAAVFASTGPGNLFTLVPLLESLQTGTPVLVVGTNIASSLLSKTGGALHETPHQTDIFRPLTRLARRVSSPGEIPEAFAAAAEIFRGPAPGPVFIEIPHDFLLAPLTATWPSAKKEEAPSPAAEDLAKAVKLIAQSERPVFVVGGGIGAGADQVRQFAEKLRAPVFTTTSGKGVIADGHPLVLGCISRLSMVEEVLQKSDLMISVGARLTEFDTGRFALSLPATHLRIVEHPSYAGDRFPATVQLTGEIGAVAQQIASQSPSRAGWCDIAASRAQEEQRLQALQSDALACLGLLRAALDRDDILANDQSILSYWASAFFPVLAPSTFLYPIGSGTLGYGLPAAIGAACALRRAGQQRKVVCIAGDGGFQYTQHELATLAQYDLPVKILLVNDEAYGIIGFLQRAMFGKSHEVALKNPDFCLLAGAHGVRAERAVTLDDLRQKLPGWLGSSGPALLEWRTQLKAPWEVGAIPRLTGRSGGQQK
jgi:acetolactate synthase-1/2/3 large subunit